MGNCFGEDLDVTQGLSNPDSGQVFSFKDISDGIFSEPLHGKNEILLKDNKN